MSLPAGASPSLAATRRDTYDYPPTPSQADYSSREKNPVDYFRNESTQAISDKSELPNSASQIIKPVSWYQRILRTREQRLFLVIIAVQGLAVLGLQGALFGLLDQDLDLNNRYLKSIGVYLSIFILAEIVELLFAIDALRLKNFLQVAGLLIFTAAMLAYSALMYDQVQSAVIAAPASDCAREGTCPDAVQLFHKIRGILIAIPCVIGAALIALCLLAWPLYKDFHWDVFKLLGANMQIKKMFQWYQIFVVFLKFDSFFFVGFCVQLLVLVTGLPTYEKVLTIVALPFVIALLILAAISVRMESRFGMLVYALGMAAGLTYFVYKLVRIFDTSDARSNNYESNRRSLALFASICIALILLTAVVSIKVFMNFGKGLAQALPKYSGKRRITPEEAAGGVPDEVRMELD